MVQVSYPGVYVQERSSGVRTITGVSTSIAAFFGRTSKGPINRPVRCLSRSDFIRTFGSAHPHSELGASLTQFYANGGTDCYVVRLASASAAPASVTLMNQAKADRLRATAKSEGAWGNGIRLEVDYSGPNSGEAFNLRVALEEGGVEVASERFENLTMNPASPRFAPSFVTQSSELIDLALTGLPMVVVPAFSEARRPLGTDGAGVRKTLEDLIKPPSGLNRFDISVDGSPYVTVDLSTIALTDVLTATETALKQQVNAVLGSLIPARSVSVTVAAGKDASSQPLVGGQLFLRITAATLGGENGSVRVRRAAAHDLASALLLGDDNGGVERGGWSEERPVPTGSVVRADNKSRDLEWLNTITGLQQLDITSITIAPEPSIPLNLKTTAAAGTDPFYKDGKPGTSPSGHNDGVREKLQIIAKAISTAPGSRYRAEVQGYELVILAKDGIPNEQSTAITFGGPTAATVAKVNAAIQLNTRQYSLGDAGTSLFAKDGPNGQDGGALSFADYVGDPVNKKGFYALDRVDLFNLMILPADADTTAADAAQLWGPASIYCSSRRAFLLVDPPASWTGAAKLPSVVQNTSEVNDLRATVVKDHSAVYYPQLRINDGGLIRTIGPTGTIAGLMARVDATRGVWKAPAGTEADLRGIIGLDVTLTDLENGVLNKLGVNCLRSFISGSVSWGARTLDGADDLGSEWKYIPIRRLALFIEESLYRGTQWVVFEPNDEPLWANIRLNVGVFMNQLFRQGAFQGSTPDQAYYVKCDSETTTQADRNLGIVNIEVGFAPLKPAEFVVITIQQIAGDLL